MLPSEASGDFDPAEYDTIPAPPPRPRKQALASCHLCQEAQLKAVSLSLCPLLRARSSTSHDWRNVVLHSRSLVGSDSF